MKLFGSTGLENTTFIPTLGKSCGAGLATIGLAGAGIGVITLFVRNMRLSSQTNASICNTARAKVQSNYRPSLLYRAKKTDIKSNAKLEENDPLFGPVEKQVEFKNLEKNQRVSLCVIPRVADQEAKFKPNIPKGGVSHPVRVSYVPCHKSCKLHPCDNPFCPLLIHDVDGFDTHYKIEPLTTEGTPVYAPTATVERVGRIYTGKDLKNKAEYTVVYARPKTIKAKEYDLAPNSGTNADTVRNYYLNEKIKQTRTNRPVIIDTIKDINDAK